MVRSHFHTVYENTPGQIRLQRNRETCVPNGGIKQTLRRQDIVLTFPKPKDLDLKLTERDYLT